MSEDERSLSEDEVEKLRPILKYLESRDTVSPGLNESLKDRLKASPFIVRVNKFSRFQ